MTSQVSSPRTQAAPIASGMPPVIILADDLTGACDSAAAFVGKADAVRVLLHPVSAQANASQAGQAQAHQAGGQNQEGQFPLYRNVPVAI